MKKKYWVISIVCFICFLATLFFVVKNGVAFYDNWLMNIAYSLRGKKLSFIFKIITFLGDSKFIILISCLLGGYLFFFRKNKNMGILVVLNTINTALLNQGIKYIVRRPRPVNLIIDEDGYSFPSGHSMMSICFYALMIYFIWKSNLKKDIKIILTCLLVLLLYIIGFTRVYFGAHYPSDILAGYLVTISYMIIFVPMYNKIMND